MSGTIVAMELAPPPSTMGAKPGESVQRKWWSDVDLLSRVRRVHSLTEQGLFASKIARLLKVSERTVQEDRSRYLELAREDIKQDVKDHIARLDQIIEEALVAFHAISASTTFGVKRSDYLNIIRQAVMDKAKLDGSLNAEQQIQIGVQVNLAPAPNELYEQGKLADDDYQAHLRVLALQAGAQVIEGEVLSPAAEPTPALRPDLGPKSQVARRRATSPPPSREASQGASPSLPAEDPLLAEFVPDPPDDHEEEEEE